MEKIKEIEEINLQKEYIEKVKKINENKNLKYSILTMGCQLNENDSEKLCGMLEEMGYTKTENQKEADLALFNTCCVRENAEDKLFGKLGELKKIKEERGTIIAIGGCMMQEKHITDKIKESYPFVDILFGTHTLHKFPEDLYKVIEEKRKLEEFSTISLVYFKEIISQYEGLPFESLLLDNIITQEEYDNLKHFTLINECKKCIHMLSDNNMLDKDKYYTSVHLNHCMLLFMNKLARMFRFIEVQIEAENKWIKTHLDDIYYNEVYLFSDEYVEQWAERAEAEAEYYAEHPEAFEDMEESEEDRLFEKINEAIWAGDVETIKKCFPQIDKNDKQIQAELTWIVAKDVMKNRELRELYFQKYGVKYKVRKEKRRNS